MSKDGKKAAAVAGGLAALVTVVALARRKKAAPVQPGLVAISVSFNSPAFTPGSTHEVVITVKNSGTAPATGVGGIITLLFGDIPVEVGTGLPATINPGATVVGRNYFVIPRGAMPGVMSTWTLHVDYSGRVLLTLGNAFTVAQPATLQVMAVAFLSPPFYPGGTYEADVTIKNTGADKAVGVGGTLNIIYAEGGTPIGAGLPAEVPAGATLVGRAYFVIPSGVVPGQQTVWTFAGDYASENDPTWVKSFSAQGSGFLVETPAEPFLELVPPVSFV